MRTIALAITGLGNVGRNLLSLLEQQSEILRSRFDLEFIVTGACDSSGALFDSNGLNVREIISIKEQKKGIAGVAGMNAAEFVQSVKADILVELTLTNLQDGEPGLGAI